MRVEFMDGCEGNLQGIASLVEGMEVAEVIKRLRGIDCSDRGTSCPDQLARALEEGHDKPGSPSLEISHPLLLST